MDRIVDWNFSMLEHVEIGWCDRCIARQSGTVNLTTFYIERILFAGDERSIPRDNLAWWCRLLLR